jgi:hypothetical protein
MLYMISELSSQMYKHVIDLLGSFFVKKYVLGLTADPN